MWDFALAPFTKDTPTPCTDDPQLFDPWDDDSGEPLEDFARRTETARTLCHGCRVLFQCQSWSRNAKPGEITGVLAGQDELARFNQRMSAKRRQVDSTPGLSARKRDRILFTPAAERRLVIPAMLAAGMTLQEMAAALCVRVDHLEGDFERNGWPMPGAPVVPTQTIADLVSA